ncbi:ABC transporter ATP-binding protein [Actinocorallia aurantiaca]|uniref:ABC transporter ATP-binding protein n=1 Tax=Actinocorallia aurantiaca TaxID=46204 RepID=A0ABP6GT61_9ACTN
MSELLRLEGLRVGYTSGTGTVTEAVRGLDLRVNRGEVVALVGESGSGKSSSAHAAGGLLSPSARVTGGRILFAGQDVTHWPERAWRSLRGAEIGFVPQDPGVSLNPVRRVGSQVADALLPHGHATRRTVRARVEAVLEQAGLPDPRDCARRYPHELSGGMRQRVLIGIALACVPRLLIADEPTSALDVTVQRRILDHLGRLTAAEGTAVLLITHDLGVAADRADRIVVMRDGRAVEEGPTRSILDSPRDPYTRRLLDAVPTLGAPPLITSVPVADAPGKDGAAPLLELRSVTKEFRRGSGVTTAVRGVDLVVPRGRTVGLVGESGSGKSTIARMALRLTAPTSGRVLFDGIDLTGLSRRELRPLRRRFQPVYQNPFSSLDPRLSVGEIIGEPLDAFGEGDRAARRRRAAELLDQVALPAETIDRRPAELSGGQRQRVAIARALALRPELIVLDEPVSALDVSVQDQILRLLVDLQAELGLSYLFISHDLAVIRQVAHEVVILRAGTVVESGPAAEIYDNPRHEYTKEFLMAIPGHAPARAQAEAGG